MKKVFLVLLILISISRADINWVEYDRAFGMAKKENKLVMVYVHSPSCHYCDLMEFKVFDSRRVEDILNNKFVAVKLRKCSKEGIEIRKKYGFTGTPMFYFFKPDGTFVKSVFGAWEEKDFVKILEYFYTGAYNNMSMTEYFMK